MKSIKYYYNETEFVELQIEDMAKFMRDNVEDFKQGYRLYSGQPSRQTDITEEAQAIIKADEIIMLKPAKTGVEILVGVIIAAVVGAVAAVLLTPKIEAPANQNRNQSSATNALGDRTNEADRLTQR